MTTEATRPVLVTGGAGFIGTNVADRLASGGERVIVFDSLARPGVAANLVWLRERHGPRIEVEIGDVRDPERLRPVVARAGHVFHFAAQVAVTTSLEDPIEDFEINARGTLNLLEAIRDCDPAPGLIFTSTNKVYGALDDLPLEEVGARYVPRDPTLRDMGVDESRPLDFYSPYGCSKGCADQYVLDHARTYGLRATVFRMSCIYGPHQCGTEDQGWVAHFLRSAIAGEPITIFGDGHQVRDALFVDDLVDAMLLARRGLATSPESFSGRAFNMGGGPENAISLLGLLDRIALCTGRRPRLAFGPWRPGDQRYYVSNVGRFSRLTGWRPSTRVTDGLRRLYRAFTAIGAEVADRPSAAEPTALEEAGSP